jgi:glyoxylase-like metal-dependent hydrolase (beta-lactamase superfamily II)
VNFDWERLADGVHRCRLPFLDVTVGLIAGRTAALLVDTGTTVTEAAAIAADVMTMSGRTVGHVVLTHAHFDHILGSSVFADAASYCAPEVATSMTVHKGRLRADAVAYGADPSEVDRAIAALRAPVHFRSAARVNLGDRTVSVSHPGRGHTGHDLIASVDLSGARTVVFCGDLVEESADPAIDADSDVAAWPATLDRLLHIGGEDGLFVPGHGAVVDADFIRRQRAWLLGRGV